MEAFECEVARVKLPKLVIWGLREFQLQLRWIFRNYPEVFCVFDDQCLQIPFSFVSFQCSTLQVDQNCTKTILPGNAISKKILICYKSIALNWLTRCAHAAFPENWNVRYASETEFMDFPQSYQMHAFDFMFFLQCSPLSDQEEV